MKNIKIIPPPKNDITPIPLKDGMYKNDPQDFECKIAFSLELEEGENTQYPLEDVLDTYGLYVSDFLPSDTPNIMNIVFAGAPEDIQKVAAIAGKRVYNSNYVDTDGKTYAKLVIA
ncbi:hypothetical protein [uncultured Dokdonia sp.]|uniref:hypothetical protein n=1 Tax=uncultured Dokdonia sp. TaxID=575653 RepID=UPI00261BC52F|nr:hypothetical protein [uncultured Dokdonia sp.]